MEALISAKRPISRQQYKNLIATRDLLLWHPDSYSPGSRCNGNLYDFAGFAYLVKERIKVGEPIPSNFPILTDWLGLSLKEYAMACLCVKTLDELLDAIESFLASRVICDECAPKVVKPNKATPKKATSKKATHKREITRDTVVHTVEVTIKLWPLW